MSSKTKTPKHEPDLSVTKEGIRVKAGQRWRDLDKRCPNRVRTVVKVSCGRAYFDGYPKTSVAIRRMHYHSTGWALET